MGFLGCGSRRGGVRRGRGETQQGPRSLESLGGSGGTQPTREVQARRPVEAGGQDRRNPELAATVEAVVLPPQVPSLFLDRVQVE